MSNFSIILSKCSNSSSGFFSFSCLDQSDGSLRILATSSIFSLTAVSALSLPFFASAFASFISALAFSNFSSSMGFSPFFRWSRSSSMAEAFLVRDSATFISLRTTSISPGLAPPSPSCWHNLVRSLMEIRASIWREGTSSISLLAHSLFTSIPLEVNPPRTSRLGPSLLFRTSRPSFLTSSSELANRYWASSVVVVRYFNTRSSPSKPRPLFVILSRRSSLNPQLETVFSSVSNWSLASGFLTAKTLLCSSRISPSHLVESSWVGKSFILFLSSSTRFSSSSCTKTAVRFRLPAIFYNCLLQRIEKLR